jgi:hypothetical protein
LGINGAYIYGGRTWCDFVLVVGPKGSNHPGSQMKILTITKEKTKELRHYLGALCFGTREEAGHLCCESSNSRSVRENQKRESVGTKVMIHVGEE